MYWKEIFPVFPSFECHFPGNLTLTGNSRFPGSRRMPVVATHSFSVPFLFQKEIFLAHTSMELRVEREKTERERERDDRDDDLSLLYIDVSETAQRER